MSACVTGAVASAGLELENRRQRAETETGDGDGDGDAGSLRTSLDTELGDATDKTDHKTDHKPSTVESDAPSTPTTPPLEYDTARGWLIVATAFALLFLSCGLQYSWGTYIRAYFYAAYFGPSTSLFTISFIGSLNSVAFPLGAPFVGPLIGYFGSQIVILAGAVVQALALILASFSTAAWQTLLSQGLLFGLGEVGVYLGAVQLIQQYFLKKRGLAIGIALSGSGFGGLAMNSVCQLLIDRLGFPWSLRVLGFLMLGVGLIGGLIMRPRTRPAFLERKRGVKRGKMFDLGVFRNKYFVVFYFSGAVAMFGYFVPFLMMSTYAASIGIPSSLSSLSIGLMNGASAIGRIAAGWAGDKTGYLNAFIACQLAAPAVVLLIWPFAKSFAVVVVVSILYGFFAGGLISIMPPMIVSLFGGGDAVAMLGMQMSSGLIASIAGPPLAGLITDHNTVILADGTKEIYWIPTILYAGLVGFIGNLPLLWIRGDKTGWKLRVKV